MKNHMGGRFEDEMEDRKSKECLVQGKADETLKGSGSGGSGGGEEELIDFCHLVFR